MVIWTNVVKLGGKGGRGSTARAATGYGERHGNLEKEDKKKLNTKSEKKEI